MDPNGVIKSFNILKYKLVGMFEVNDIKSVKPFSILRKIFIFVLVGIANAIDTQIIPNNPAIRSTVILFYLTDEGMKCLKKCGTYIKDGVDEKTAIRNIVKEKGYAECIADVLCNLMRYMRDQQWWGACHATTAVIFDVDSYTGEKYDLDYGIYYKGLDKNAQHVMNTEFCDYMDAFPACKNGLWDVVSTVLEKKINISELQMKYKNTQWRYVH